MEPKEKEILEKINHAVANMRETNEERLSALEKDSGRAAALEEKIEKQNAEIDKLQEKLNNTAKSAENAELAAKRRFGNPAQSEEMSEDKKLVKMGMEKYFRNQSDKITPEERHAMSSYSDTDGGYTIQPELDIKILEKVRETSPIRQVANIITLTQSDQYEQLVEGELAGARWKNKETSGGETDGPKLNKVSIRAHELEAEPKAPVNLLNDSGINIEDLVRNSVAKRFSLSENTAFVSGDGVGQPKGFLAYPAGTSDGQIERVNSGAAAAFTGDGIIDLIYALKSGYRARASFMASRLSIAALRKLKDGQNNYLWQPSFQAGQPQQLCGFPLYEANDMPDVAANALSLAFGDFSVGYTIVDRLGTTVLVNPYKEHGFVIWYTTRRVGGGVEDFDAIKLQTIAA